jgi:hypothetical protein
LYEAEQAANKLRRALRARGLTLPNLAVDISAATAGFPLVNLGAASAETVLLMAEAFDQTSNPGK